MEEKEVKEPKKFKISLATVICIIIIIILLLVIGFMYYYYNYYGINDNIVTFNNNERNNTNETSDNLQNSTNAITNNTENNTSNTIYDELINITKEIETKEENRGYDFTCSMISLEEISEKDGEYYATAIIRTLLEITNKQYNDMVKNKKIELDGIEYEYYAESNAEKYGGITAEEYGSILEKGYGAIKGFKEYDGNSYEIKYKVIKYNEGYAFLEIPAIESIWVYYTKEIVELPIKNDTLVYDAFENTENTVEDYKDIINERSKNGAFIEIISKENNIEIYISSK